MSALTIGAVARQAGVATSTIRYYERIGLLPASARVNGRRRYDETILRKLGVIRLAQGAGLTIAEIQTLVNDFPQDTPPAERWQSIAVDKISQLDTLLLQIQAKKALLEKARRCHCATLEDCGAGL